MSGAIPPIHHAFMACTGTSLVCTMSRVVKFKLHVTIHYIYISSVFTGKARYRFEDNIKMVPSQAFLCSGLRNIRNRGLKDEHGIFRSAETAKAVEWMKSGDCLGTPCGHVAEVCVNLDTGPFTSSASLQGNCRSVHGGPCHELQIMECLHA